jgi:hypothetical protein
MKSRRLFDSSCVKSRRLFDSSSTTSTFAPHIRIYSVNFQPQSHQDTCWNS